MTSTNKGEWSSDRNSSRVLAPPGGRSSNIFGDPQEPPVRQTPPKAKPAPVAAAPPAEPASQPTPPAPKQQPSSPGGPSQSCKPRGQSFNIITGESYGAKEPNAPQNRGGRQPPGGASSGLW